MNNFERIADRALLKKNRAPLLFMLLMSLSACPEPSSIDVDGAPAECEAGATKICSCSLGVMGEQSCDADGYFTNCICNTDNIPPDLPPDNPSGGHNDGGVDTDDPPPHAPAAMWTMTVTTPAFLKA